MINTDNKMSNAKNMTDQKSKSIIDYQKNHSSDNIPTLRFPEFNGEWEKKKLGEVAEFSKGKGISKADIVEDGETECIRYGELYTVYGETINEVKSKTNIAAKSLVFSEANDVIIPASGETQIDIATASCVVRKGIALGGDLNVIKTKNNGVFLSYFLNSAKKQEIANLAQGISVVHLYSSQLSTLNLSFPTLPEQTKIAEFFTAIDKKISHLKTKKQLLQQYKKGVMQQLFSSEAGYSGLEDEQDFDETHPTILKCQNQDIKDLKMNRINNKTNPTILKSRKSRFRQDDGSEFPKWEMKKLGEIGEITTGKLDANAMVENGEYRFYTCARDFYRIDKFAFDTEALLISGNGANVGYIHYYKGKFNAYQRTYVLDGFKENIIFIKYFLDKNLYERINLEKKEGNTPYIVLSTLSEMEISIPSLPEQTKIANFLSSIDEKINRTETQIEQTQTWKKGLLQKMFI